MGFSVADCGLRIADWRMGLPVLLVALIGVPSIAEETEAQRTSRLQTMTAEQKDELIRKKKSFDEIEGGDAARERLRALHGSIEAAPNSAELEQTLSRYHAWLGTLSSIQRDEVRDLPADKRIERIKELLKQQEAQRFQAFVGNLEEDDRKAIFKWLGDFVTEHEEQILEQLKDHERENIRGIPDQDAKQRALGFVMAMQRQNPKMPAPDREDFNRLMASLSPKAVAQIEQAPATEQPDRIREMVRGAIFSRRIPPVSDEELRKYYTSLKPEQRERLEGLEAEEFKRRLTWMYHGEKRGGWQPGRGPGSGGGFGFPGPGGPGDGARGDGRRGDGRRPKGPPPDGQGPRPGPPTPPGDQPLPSEPPPSDS